jgi:hypothetical protein
VRELRRRLQRAFAQATIRIGASREVALPPEGAEAPAKGT